MSNYEKPIELVTETPAKIGSVMILDNYKELQQLVAQYKEKVMRLQIENELLIKLLKGKI